MKIKVKSSFFLVLSLMFFLERSKFFIFAMICSLLHESGHIIALKVCNISINECKISAVGGAISTERFDRLSAIKKLMIFSFGIIFNAVFGIICYIIAQNGFYSQNFFLLCGINFLLAFFNLLPIFSLDGYNILYTFLNMLKNTNFCNNFCSAISLILNFSLVICGIFLLFNKNFSLLLVALYLLFLNLKNNTNFKILLNS